MALSILTPQTRPLAVLSRLSFPSSFSTGHVTNLAADAHHQLPAFQLQERTQALEKAHRRCLWILLRHSGSSMHGLIVIADDIAIAFHTVN
jgi:hypothetical protein